MIIGYFILIICLLNGVKSQTRFIPQIIEQIETAVIPEKGVAYLNCTMVIEEKEFNRAIWTDNNFNKVISKGKSLQIKAPEKVSSDIYEVNFKHQRSSYIPVMPGQSTEVWVYQLIIRDFDPTWSREYKCEIDIEGILEKTVAIGRVILNQTPYINPIPSVIINEGERLEMVCSGGGSPKPTLSWVKANGQAFPLPKSPQRVKNGTIVIPKVGRYDRGVYRCHSQNNVGRAAEYDVMVEVTFAPTVRFARRSGAYAQMPNQNYQIMIECVINGYPDPDLYWYKGVYDPNKSNILLENDIRYLSEKIVSYGAVGTNITDVFFVLRILNVVEGDFGNYSCVAKNKMGYDMKVVNIFQQQVCQGSLCSIMPGLRSSVSTVIYQPFIMVTMTILSVNLIGYRFH